MLLDDLQILLNTDTSEDMVLTFYIRKAKTLIANYLKSTGIDIEATYPDAIIEYVTIQWNKRGNEGVKQFSQGSISGTYVDDIPLSVKVLLPLPSIRMMG